MPVFDFAKIVAARKSATKQHSVTFTSVITEVNAAYGTSLSVSTNSIDWSTLTDGNASVNERFQSIGRLCLPLTREAFAGHYDLSAVHVLVAVWGETARSIENRDAIPVSTDAATAWIRSAIAMAKSNGSTFVAEVEAVEAVVEAPAKATAKAK